LSRALAVFMPGLTLAGVSALALLRDPLNPFDAQVLTILCGSYFAIPLVGAALGRLKVATYFKAPRTDAPALRAYAGARASSLTDLGDVVFDSMTWTAGTLLTTAAWMALRMEDSATAWIVFAGSGLTLLSGWAWWRIVKTYMTYLRLFHDLKPAENVGSA
jgi:hypothetical protein